MKSAAKLFSVVMVIVIAGAVGASDRQPSAAVVCPLVAKALSPSDKSNVMPLYVDWLPGEGRSVSYQGVDLDLDGEPDRLIQDCGSPSEGSCTLRVSLSRGGFYDFTESPFRVVRFQDHYYILVGDRFPDPTPKGERQLFLLRKNMAALICNAL